MKPIPKAELERAQAWRCKARWYDADGALQEGLTMAQLSDLTGYSPSAICRFELGLVPPSQTMGEHPVTAKAWRRYKMICLAVDALLKARKQVEDWQWR